jgi:hypothetical protein
MALPTGVRHVFNLPFDQPGRFFRGNIHCHSSRSDGHAAPEDVVNAYRDQGYDFVSLTDHFMERFSFPVTDTSVFRTARFTTLLGAELHGPALENGQNWHIVAVGLPLDFAPESEHEPAVELTKRAAEAGAFVGVAHPAWYGVTPQDVELLATAHAIEIFNTGHSRDADRGDGWYLADLLAARGQRYHAFAADDAHFGPRPDRFGGWVMVRADSLEPGSLLQALKEGYFYSSQGPTLEYVGIENDEIVVSCSPVVSIHAAGRPPINRYAITDGEGPITSARFPLEPFAGNFCRITVIDERGRRAWTNPFWLDGYGPDITYG